MINLLRQKDAKGLSGLLNDVFGIKINGKN